MKYAIVGNPNCGKTTIFNALTGMNQKVGNWTGVTVDKKVGFFEHKGQKIEIVDLPGIYSLSASDQSSIDEQIACRYILTEKPDAVINVIDASNLERNLYLTIQLLEMQVPVILVVNMIDVANQKGLVIHYEKLAAKIGCTVVPVIGRKRIGIDDLKDQLLKPAKLPHLKLDTFYPQSCRDLESALHQDAQEYPTLWLASRIIEKDFFVSALFTAEKLAHFESLRNQYIQSENADVDISTSRYQVVSHLIENTTDMRNLSRHKFTEAVDKVCMNKYLGIPVFLFVMYLMFQLSITIGGALQPLFDNTSNVIFVDGVIHLGLYLGIPTWIITIVAQGFGLGVNTVVTFVPQIGLMFLFLSILEDSGYMARAAFVMDRFMQAIGLPGKAFVPLIVGFGCNVPAIMAARTLETRRDRLMTIMMAPFISCGARLAIFAVFASAFFPQGGATIIFLLYLAGIIGAILTGYVIKFTFLKGQSAPFVMEIPVYHLPQTKTVLLYSWNRLKMFLIRAGKIIIPVCIIVGTMNSVQLNGQIVQGGSQQSVLAQMSKTITPVFSPMGIEQDNWPSTVGLVTGTLAKEVVVGTLNTLYTQQKPQDLEAIRDEPYNFWEDLKGAWDDTIDNFKNIDMATLINPVEASKADASMDKTAMGTMVTSFGSVIAAFAFMLFVLLYVPCISVVGAMAREATRGWAIISVVWSLVIAYAAAVIVYQGSYLISAPAQAIFWIIAMIALLAIVIGAMKYMAMRIRFQTAITGCGSCVTLSNPKKSGKGSCH